MSTSRYLCPCCRNRTLDEQPPGTYDICPVCYWEDDPLEFEDPSYAGGANGVSLLRARENYNAFGAVSRELIVYVRKPYPEEIPSEE